MKISCKGQPGVLQKRRKGRTFDACAKSECYHFICFRFGYFQKEMVLITAICF